MKPKTVANVAMVSAAPAPMHEAVPAKAGEHAAAPATEVHGAAPAEHAAAPAAAAHSPDSLTSTRCTSPLAAANAAKLLSVIGRRMQPKPSAEIPNPDRLLRPGMLMTVTLLKNPRDALVVPESAILSSGRKSHVLRIDAAAGNRVERREVTIGARRTGEVEVLAGLAVGDLVVVHGTQRVRDGQTVQILPAEAAATGP